MSLCLGWQKKFEDKMSKKMKKEIKNLRIQVMPFSEVKDMGIAERVKKILDLVLGNKIVPLQERIEYIFKKYGKWIQKNNIDWEATQQEQFDYEQQIFKHLPFTPEELARQVTL